MKKIFTLIAAALMAVGASAQTTLFSMNIKDGLSADVTSEGGSQDKAYALTNYATFGVTGTSAVFQQMAAQGNDGAKYIVKQNGAYYFSLASSANKVHFILTLDQAIEAGDVITYNLFCGKKSDTYGLLFGAAGATTDAVGPEASTSTADKGIIEHTYTVKANDAIVGKKAIYVMRNTGKSTYFDKLVITRPAPSTDPSLSVSPDELSFSLTPSKTSASETFTISGANLTAGTYNFNVPNLAGLSINPTSFTVGADGKVSQEVTVTYTSTEDVAKASANITATVGDLTATVAVNYQSRSTAYTQSIVKADATWDWSQLTESLQLNDETTPKKGDEYILAEVDDRITFTDAFGDAKALKVDLEHPSRAGYAQGNTIKFTTNRAGKLAVDFSNTGGSRPYRYLNVNGTNTTFKSDKTDKVSATEIEVPAGEVVITGYIVDATDPQAKDGDVVGKAGLRYYKIVFTATGEEEDITGINTVATDAAKANVVKKYVDGKQVVIEKNGKKYNVAGAQIK